MSKELEALNGLAQFIIINDIGTDESASAIEWHGIIKKALERAKKEHELLELYRKHINNLCKKEREGVKNSMFSSEHLAYELYEKIKQLEEELEELK
jgi:uncharacterized protein YktA (UPF0223 family)